MEQSLIFGDVISSDYGIYISGEGVFNAPRRDAEMISIPGRNGTYLLDHNRFDNIVVTYPAHCVADNMDEFRSKLRDYRNALSAKRGYQRLSDTINGDEYRMASFIDGFDSEPIGFSLASTFELKFNCKPQRFLKIGEIETPVSSGDTITNPTLFESHPLLLVDGYGALNINGEPITILQGTVMGDTTLYNGGAMFSSPIYNIPIDNNLYFTGDIITVTSQPAGLNRMISISEEFEVATGYSIQSIEVETLPDNIEASINRISEGKFALTVGYNGTTQFTAGTSSNSSTRQATFKITATYNGNEVVTRVIPQLSLSYTAGTNDTITARGLIGINGADIYRSKRIKDLSVSLISVYSTKSALGQLYIDLDIGECYRIENGQIISINTATILPADLPTLKPGDNVITYDNTFTSFKVTPRYWRV